MLWFDANSHCYYLHEAYVKKGTCIFSFRVQFETFLLLWKFLKQESNLKDNTNKGKNKTKQKTFSKLKVKVAIDLELKEKDFRGTLLEREIKRLYFYCNCV